MGAAEMTTDNPQVPWTDEQWARVNQVIQEEASRARVAATFLPLIGPLSGHADFVRAEIVPPNPPLTIQDRQIIQLATLQVMVPVRGAQIADPDMRSVLALFRRAANVLARLEDAVIFRGLITNGAPPPEFIPPGGIDGIQEFIDIHGGQETPGLWGPPPPAPWPWQAAPAPARWQWISLDRGSATSGQDLVVAVSDAVGRLEGRGHFGPFAVVLGQALFLVAQTPDLNGYVLPQDRIIPFLGGGQLLRSSTLDDIQGYIGVVITLGGSPIELVVATDLSLQFLQVTNEPRYLFRVRERIALRIKEPDAIVRLVGLDPHPPAPIVNAIRPTRGPAAGNINVVITGANLFWATRVEFDGSITEPNADSTDQRITVTLPAHAAGQVNVTVTTPGGANAAGSLVFTYQ